MRYRVRTPDGELDYLSFREVELAYIQGLVGPDDEVREEGQTLWRKASTIPLLARARPPDKGLMARGQLFAVVGAVLMGIWALMLIMSESWSRRGLGIVLALATSALLTRVTYKAFKRPGGTR
ncbi:hypothetical protein [Melittangium boletus]|uniref:Uncharacterized protein n=1 Tax=Melittangium boletus DSM 14713 TaxID=1294270 RepID=A0A250I6X6_9BACT|nr:hypothetical protein [Melittangium boletus]ATB26912.1 hypothetical protein MEBOL_000347 [Melittangium boletus DSM 14713]